MTFKEEKVADFLHIFQASQPLISQFEGCVDVKLFRDHNYPNVYYTKSLWIGHDALEKYRNSVLFESTWAKTKILFDDRPQAYSLVDV